MTSAMLDLSTIELTPTQSVSSRGEIVGARRPGVTAVAVERIARRMLYWHTTYLRAAITPAMRAVILSISGTRCGCFGAVDRIRTASDCSSVAMGRKPAARIVSPDSEVGGLVSRETGRWDLDFFFAPTRSTVGIWKFCEILKKKEKRSGLERGERTDSICEPEGTGRFDASADVFDRGARVPDEPGAIVDVRKVARGEDLEAGDDALARERVDAPHGSRFGNLHLERALSKAEPERLGHEGLHL